MVDSGKSRADLLSELNTLRQRVRLLEAGQGLEHSRDGVDDMGTSLLYTILEALGHPFYVINADNYCIEVANEAAVASGISGQSTCYALTHGRDAPCEQPGHPCPLQQIKRTGKAAVVEHVHRNPEGSKRYVEVHAYPIFDQQGRVSKVIEYSLDITRRKQAEDALREREQLVRRLSMAVEQSPATVVITDTAGDIEYVNPRFTELTGYRAEDALGRNPRFLKSGLQPGEFYRELWKCIWDGKEWRGEFCNQRKDGSKYWEHATISPIRDGQGDITGFVKIGEDVTSRRRTEESLRWELQVDAAMAELARLLLSFTSLKEISDQVLDYACDLTDSEMGYVGYVDPDSNVLVCSAGSCALERELHFHDQHAVMGEPARPDSGLPQSNQADPEPRCWEATGDVPDIRQVLSTPAIIGDHRVGELVLANAGREYTGRDELLVKRLAALYAIALQRHWADEALRQRTAELEARNEELDAFSHTVAHDLKNPLSLILGFSEVLQDEFLELEPEATQKYLSSIARSGRKMRDIIDELLLLAGVRRLEAPSNALDMARIVSEAKTRLAHMIGKYDARIVEPAEWPAALGYGPWVEAIWVNYLSNGIKYGGTPPRIELGAEDVGEQVRFWARDNGVGLSREKQSKLFTPFTQLGQARIDGHGLGLSIVRRIAEKLGGTVEVESEGIPGQGSIFSFTLPAAKE